jgi:hypothetical protein
VGVSAKRTGRSATGGSGTPVRPGQPLHPGLVFSGSVGRHRGVYVGIAGPQASRVLVRVVYQDTHQATAATCSAKSMASWIAARSTDG